MRSGRIDIRPETGSITAWLQNQISVSAEERNSPCRKAQDSPQKVARNMALVSKAFCIAGREVPPEVEEFRQKVETQLLEKQQMEAQLRLDEIKRKLFGKQ